MDDKDVNGYKKMHEDFMKNLNGTSIWENFVIISPSCVYTFLTSFLVTRLFINFVPHKCGSLLFLFEFCTLILPLLLNFTFLSEYSFELFIFFIIASSTQFFINLKSVKKLSYNTTNISPASSKPFIAYFKAIVNIITAICILAVDFKTFPRRFAKAETFGYGLMDTGVGFYIVTNAIVVKNKHNGYHRVAFIGKTAVSVLPLLFLGCIRLISVSSLDYQLHVSEYGVHWNFFFTLAFVKFFSAILLSFWPKRVVPIIVVIAVTHQTLLTFVLQDWALDEIPRDNIFRANREGLISLPGYLSLFLCAFVMGEKIRTINTPSDRIKKLPTLFISFVGSLALTLFCEILFDVSRRFANITYILWMLSLSIYIIIIAIFTELALLLSFEKHKSPNLYFIPNILSSVNYNGLTFFLSSNLLTGLINKSFHTIFMDDGFSLLIIIIYMFINCAVSTILYNYKIRLKWW